MNNPRELKRLKTYIPGFDLISNGGLPAGRTTLVSGGPGSAKTILAGQFLAAGIEHAGEAGCFVTFEEKPDDIRRNLSSLGWEIAKWESEGKWIFVDGSLHPRDEPVTIGDYDLGGLMARIDNAVKKIGAQRVSLDSIGAMLVQFGMPAVIRRELYRVAWQLRDMGVTSIITAEHTGNSDPPVEEYVTDNVIILRNTLEDEKRRRTLEILKFRGASHSKGEFPFTIAEDSGIILLPLSSIELRQKSTETRITSGIVELDAMCGGGFYRDSVVLISGATGTGKTLTATEFLAALGENERGLMFAFEESRDQLYRNALGWGVDFPALESAGRLRIVCEYPEVAAPEDHLLRIKKHIEEFRPTRVAVDSLSALERISTLRTFREFVLALTSYLKDKQIAGLFTSTTPSLLGGSTVTEAHISSVTDSIILLRYVEAFGEMRRGITVLKMRGSQHDRNIREYTIDSRGMHVGEPFRGISGILSGTFTHAANSELQTLQHLFERTDAEDN
ncbi:MAG: circadian clock protein KaiC [Bryobacterales bacterium]|nr:circadian clock protein KaiC [Bryobacterales bacterium]MBV9399028.1 circadian clock protein KaiC [Bryobacterales bacterium]